MDSSVTDLTGRDIDRYHMIEQIGQGGMVVVYKIYDLCLLRSL